MPVCGAEKKLLDQFPPNLQQTLYQLYKCKCRRMDLKYEYFETVPSLAPKVAYVRFFNKKTVLTTAIEWLENEN